MHTNKKSFLPEFAFVMLGILVLSNPTVAKNAVFEGLLLCAKAVIPPLFPFAVITGFLFADGKGFTLPKLVTLPISVVTGVPKCLVSALVTGLFAGFPMGAIAVNAVYENGLCTKKEALYTLCLASMPSPAFVIGIAGQSAAQSTKAGVFMLAIMLASILPTSLLLRFTLSGRDCCTPLQDNCKKSISDVNTKQKSFLVNLTCAVRNAGTAMLGVCSFVVFFKVLYTFLLGSSSATSSPFYPLLVGIFEMTGGINALDECSLGVLHKILLCLVIMGFGGISVLCQTVSIFGQSISYGTFIVSRIYLAFFYFVTALCAMIFIPHDFGENVLQGLLPHFSHSDNTEYFTAAFVFGTGMLILIIALAFINGAVSKSTNKKAKSKSDTKA